MAESSDQKLDTTGLLCPIPIVKLSRQLDDMEPGENLTVLADDPAFPEDLKAWAESHPHELVRLEESGEQFEALIRKRKELTK